MKFITEMELRDLYKIDPFSTYVLEPDTKITPGARQFLMDRGVKLLPEKDKQDKQDMNGRTAVTAFGNMVNKSRANPGQETLNWCVQRLRGRLEWIESLFQVIGTDLYSCGDAVLAEEVLLLGKCVCSIKNAERNQTAPDKIEIWEWSETEIKNCSNNLEKYFDIHNFHGQLHQGKTMAQLNHLRVSLREVEIAILEAYWNEERQACTREDLIEKVNIIINVLRIMMWKCQGGQKCKP